MIIMRIPQQVSERVKEAPAQALRAVFSGIGQVLLVADRIKTRATEPGRAQPTATDGPGQNAAAAPKDEARWRSLDETGNVRLLPEDEAPAPAEPAAAKPAADTESAAAVEPAAVPEPAEVTEPAAVTEPPAVTEPAVAETVAGAEPAALPVPNYDDLTVASLRARLRNLDSAQVRVLLDYEKGNAGRAAVLTMFERRIAKLESGEA
jgi:hypothetical protein